MSGQSQLTMAMDVYAYAITCVEILTMGRMPWPLMDNDAVRHFVLSAFFSIIFSLLVLM
jgi:abelson tyrosine-protein kinase 1